MANFDISVAKVLKVEGGYQQWKSDKGNYNNQGELVGTNKGISAEAYEDFFKQTATLSAMKNLTTATAKKIYKKKYWQRIQGDSIVQQNVADVFLDGAVNHGRGIHLMQEVLAVKADGVVGPVTLKALNEYDPNELVTAYLKRRELYYHQLVAKDKSQAEFLEGWLDRLEKVKKSLVEYVSNPEKKKNVLGGVVVALLVFWGLTTLIDTHK
jgi:lysozyme family protein